LANRKTVHVQAIGGDVLAQNTGPEFHGFQSLAVHEQDLTLAARPRMGAVFEAGATHGADFG
jgi:hypothetical protein